MAAFRKILTSRKRRIAAAVTLALVLAPGTFVRTAIPDQRAQALSIARVTDLPDEASAGGVTREGVWHLTSPNMDFGGYSALLLLDEGRIGRAFSDRGSVMTFDLPDMPQSGDVQLENVGDRGRLNKYIPDIEAATRDPATGDYWLAFEGRHAIIRYSEAGALRTLREPPEWNAWSINSGAEAMARLPDGRFLVLPERSREGLLYPADPTDEGEPLRFTVDLPRDFAPTDLAALADGRVLVLLRRVAIGLPPFNAALGIADPRSLEEGGELEVVQLLDLDRIVPPDNYEGLAVQQRPNGSYTLWIIADDNLASFQRTLLVKLVWDGTLESEISDGHEKTREE